MSHNNREPRWGELVGQREGETLEVRKVDTWHLWKSLRYGRRENVADYGVKNVWANYKPVDSVFVILCD